jgi:hypothetical protein
VASISKLELERVRKSSKDKAKLTVAINKLKVPSAIPLPRYSTV